MTDLPNPEAGAEVQVPLSADDQIVIDAMTGPTQDNPGRVGFTLSLLIDPTQPENERFKVLGKLAGDASQSPTTSPLHALAWWLDRNINEVLMLAQHEAVRAARLASEAPPPAPKIALPAGVQGDQA